jgi:hypothetical protein
VIETQSDHWEKLYKHQVFTYFLVSRMSQVQTPTPVQTQTQTTLEDLVEKLEELGRIEELRDKVQWLKYLAMELKYYTDRDASMFVIMNAFKMTDISIVGKYTGCMYFNVSLDPKSTALYDIFSRFFDSNIFVNVIRCLADGLSDIANIIDSALPPEERDP